MSSSATHTANTLVFAKDHLLAMISDTRVLFTQRIERHKKYKQALLELNSLSRRELSDIGISPSDIKRLALETSLEQTS